MSRDERYALHPAHRATYAHVQSGAARWDLLPQTIEGIGPLLHVDYAKNEGESTCGTLRVIAGLTDWSDVHALELQFHPLTGEVGWWWHREIGTASGGAPLTRLAVDLGYQPMLYAIHRFIELLDECELEAATVFPMSLLWLMLLKHPMGRGYRKLSKTDGATLARLVRAAPALPAGPVEAEDGGWYALSRQKAAHESETDDLEVYVGKIAVWDKLPRFMPDDEVLCLTIQDKGRGPAMIKRCHYGQIHGIFLPDRERFFPVREKFAAKLRTYVTPRLEDGNAVLHRLRTPAEASVTPEPKEP